MLVNITTGRVEQDSPFPTDTDSFLGLESSKISLTSTGEVPFFKLLNIHNTKIM